MNNPFRIGAGSFLKFHVVLRRPCSLAPQRPKDHDGVVLALLDCKDDCPADLGPEVLRQADVRPDVSYIVSLAYSEFETWFCLLQFSLGVYVRGLPENLSAPEKPESYRDAGDGAAETNAQRLPGDRASSGLLHRESTLIWPEKTGLSSRLVDGVLEHVWSARRGTPPSPESRATRINSFSASNHFTRPRPLYVFAKLRPDTRESGTCDPPVRVLLVKDRQRSSHCIHIIGRECSGILPAAFALLPNPKSEIENQSVLSFTWSAFCLYCVLSSSLITSAA